jgi:hypothetical protein
VRTQVENLFVDSWASRSPRAFASADPHKEHDLGRIEVGGEAYFWKIGYYAPDMEHGSESPADPEQTLRVLLIMRTDEY